VKLTATRSIGKARAAAVGALFMFLGADLRAAFLGRLV